MISYNISNTMLLTAEGVTIGSIASWKILT